MQIWKLSLGALLIALPLALIAVAAEAAFDVWDVLPGF